MHGFKQWFSAPIPAGAAFRIRGIGLHERMHPWMVDRRTGTQDYLIMCFHDAVRVWEPNSLRDLTPPGIVVWEPGRRHYYGSTEHTWNHSWIHGEGPFLTQALRTARLPLNRILQISEPLILEKALIDLHAAGLKVGEAMTRARRRGSSPLAAEQLAAAEAHAEQLPKDLAGAGR